MKRCDKTNRQSVYEKSNFPYDLQGNIDLAPQMTELVPCGIRASVQGEHQNHVS